MGTTPVPSVRPGVLAGQLSSSSSASSSESRERAATIEELTRHCDLAQRLTLIPPSAKVRGVYCRSIDTALAEAGKLPRYRELFPRELATLTWHPLGEFLVRLAVAGSLLAGPEWIHDGMLEIGRKNALEFARSLLGKMLVRLLSRDPRKLMLQGVAARRQTCSYGSWQVTFPEERTAMVTMVEEYGYIDSFILGAALGTFDAIGLSVKATTILDDQFNGRQILRWQT